MYPPPPGSSHGGDAGGYGQQQQSGMPNMAGFQNMANLAENPMLQSVAKENFLQMQAQLTNKYMPGASSFWNSLRYYFHVDNRYVIRKLGLLIFPWRHRQWARIRFNDESMNNDPSAPRTIDFAPPIGDVNAPDLYLPTMASITYILFIGLLKGTTKSFNPDVLQNTFSTCTLVLMVEIGAMKGSLYSLPGGADVKPALLDMVAFAGYKYVLVALNLFIGISLGRTVYNVVMFYLCLCMAFFVYRTMEQAVPAPAYEDTGHKRRLYFLVACAALQFLTIFFLGFTRDLGETTFPGFPSMPAFGADDEYADDEADV
ncbi:Protein YIF1B [Hondaea fermentalgiana]|uniref:Protein YIF1 n=1 Tax=Hondaea fermentalgiana TaxID=2315210 RepID=A0A2R5G7E6_9STRA|nr:Protein YIF1B [Hondaea fermentalgiana]|eukprot:GBG26967.1 Protein YIF1B [Hondaea fermentalgiana]